MNGKKASGEAAWVDPDDAPDLTAAFFDRAEVRQGAFHTRSQSAIRPGADAAASA